MKKFKGIPVSSGIVIGKSYLYLEEAYSIPKYDITDFNYELDRLKVAIEKTRRELIELKNSFKNDVSDDKKALFDSYILMLEDIFLIESIKNELAVSKKNIEWVLYTVIDEIISKFKEIPNDYMAQRYEDFQAVGEKIMRNLLKRNHNTLEDLKEEVVLVSRNLALTDAALMKKDKIIGLVTEIGGEASHTAIMARALSLPSVLGVEFITSEVKTGDTIIVNGYTGEVIINPDAETIEMYEKEKEAFKKYEQHIYEYKDNTYYKRWGKSKSFVQYRNNG